VVVDEYVGRVEIPQELAAPVGTPRLAPVLSRGIVNEKALELALPGDRQASRQMFAERSVDVGLSSEQIPLTDPMAQIAGTSSYIYFETDIFPGLAITEDNPGVYATAYGMLADFVRAVGEGASAL